MAKERKHDDLSAGHLKWLVEKRSENQETALKLFGLLREYSLQIRKDHDLIDVSQALVAASFSLWRAVFLSDKEGGMERSLDDAEEFLGKVILDNAINYSNDRNARDWSFDYYTNNARYRLQAISTRRTDILHPSQVKLAGVPKKDPWKHRWVFWQTTLSKAVSNLETVLAADALKDL